MKILFIKPYWNSTSANLASPPLGLLYISSSVKNKFPDIETSLLDLRFERNSKAAVKTAVKNWCPDVISILCLTGDEFEIASISRVIKETSPNVHISCGGPYPTHSPEEFNRLTDIDSIIRGEGEKSFCDLIEYLKSTKKEAFSIQGVSLRDANGILDIPDYSCPTSNIDDIPFPDWSLINIDLYSNTPQFNAVMAGSRYMVVFTSRGCPFNCIYCHNIFGKKVRGRSPENVVSEIEYLVRHYNIDEIQIVDDFFNYDRARIIKICDLIIEKKIAIKICFPNGVRGDLLDKELIVKLKQAGVYMITFAIETASERLQHVIRKNLNISKTITAIKFANKLGLLTRCFFIIGFPTETEDEIKKTIRLAASLPLTTFSIFQATPFKGTAMYSLVEQTSTKEGIESLSNPTGSFFAPNTFYTIDSGISLRKYLLLAYFMFFSPFRLIRFFFKIPKKVKYLQQLSSSISIGFMPRETKKLTMTTHNRKKKSRKNKLLRFMKTATTNKL